MVVQNPAELLSWWTPPEVTPEVLLEWRCDFCQGIAKAVLVSNAMCSEMFCQSHEKFTKFKYQYCSMKCTRKHTKELNLKQVII